MKSITEDLEDEFPAHGDGVFNPPTPPWIKRKQQQPADARKIAAAIERQRRANQKASGLCISCGEDAVNASHCEKHRRIANENANRRNRDKKPVAR